MFTGTVFNEAALDASVILQAQDVLREAIAKRIKETMPQVMVEVQLHFKTAMDRFALASVSVGKQGDPEKMVELVEKFRAYEVIMNEHQMQLYRALRARFATHMLRSMAEAKASPDGMKEVTQTFLKQAETYKFAASDAAFYYDRVQLLKCIEAWNKVAAEFTAKLAAFSKKK